MAGRIIREGYKTDNRAFEQLYGNENDNAWTGSGFFLSLSEQKQIYLNTYVMEKHT